MATDDQREIPLAGDAAAALLRTFGVQECVQCAQRKQAINQADAALRSFLRSVRDRFRGDDQH